MEHGAVASHERQFATPSLRETGCFELNEPSTNALRQEARTMQSGQGTSRRLVPLSASEQRKAVRPRTAAEPSQRLDRAALNRNLDAPARRMGTAPNATPAKPAKSATRTTRIPTSVARRLPQDERPASTMATYLVHELHCGEERASRGASAHALACCLRSV
jgi:hypothetical protein